MSLVLSRRVGETIVIGEDITVTITGIKAGQVRFAINAPADIEVDRQEVRERKQQEQWALEAQLIKGLYVLEFRDLAGTPLIWIASTKSVDHDPDTLALFHSECHGYPLDSFTVHTVWDPHMVWYHGTELERDQEAAVYDALIAECKAYDPPAPFIVPMPNSEQASIALEGAA